MTQVASGRQRKNSRARRDSVVERIAHYIPISEDHLSIDAPFTPKQTRSNSFNELKTSHDPLTVPAERILFPYSESEKQQLINQAVSSFDFNVISPLEQLSQVENFENAKYIKFLQACTFRNHNYDDLIDKSSEIVDILKDLTVKYDKVIKETSEFQSLSNQLIQKRSKYLSLNNDLKSSLHYYESLDIFTRKLNNPSPNIVRKDSFKKMLAELDECIQYFHTHTEHKDAEPYDRRFRQCLTRSLTLIRNYVINNLKSVRDNISSKLSTTSSNSVTEEALIYTRFALDSDHLLSVTPELCKRASLNEEYEGLLNDCYQFYFTIRYKFLYNKIWNHLKSSSLESKTLVQLIQGHIAHFTKIFQDEKELFYKIFPIDHKNVLTNWFQQLSEPLYDTLRNAILREQSISALCEAATLLEKYYEYEDAHDNNEFEAQSHSVDDEYITSDIQLPVIFHPILQDVQARLIFRAQVYVHEKIFNYKATSKDFQISSRRRQAHEELNIENSENNAPSLIRNNSPAPTPGLEGWFTPLGNGVFLLSQIYQLVSSKVFDDLAHYILHECLQSLIKASPIAKHTIGPLDTDLFFLRNLLMLKTHIQDFDIEYASNETFVDFSGINDIISKVRGGSLSLNEGGFFKLVRESAPKVVSNMVDARTELTAELRNLVHSFTEEAVNQIITPISVLNKETAYDDVKKFEENIVNLLPQFKNKITLFVNDHSVVTALIDGIQDLVVQTYEIYYNEVRVPHIIEIDSLITLIGDVIAKLFEDSDLQNIGKLTLEDDDEYLNVSD